MDYCLKKYPMKSAIVGVLCLAATLGVPARAQERELFENPPASCGPYVWWHWMGPNFSEEGITKDLEAMKETGVAGATIFHITSAVQESQVPTENNPWPQNTYRGENYWKAMRHAAAEAERLGLDLGLHNTAGYSTTGGPWIDEERAMQCMVASRVEVEGGRWLSVSLAQAEPRPYKGRGGTGRKAAFYRDIAVLAVPQKEHVSPDEVLDISRYMDETGRLDWLAPQGRWTIVRLGYAPTMATPHPLPDDLITRALEVDKMSKTHNSHHWESVLAPLKQQMGEYMGKSFRHILIDSYEAGKQDWTEGFETFFKKTKGYDPLPWLTGLVGSAEEKRRFETDRNDVIAQLYLTNGFKTGRDYIRRYGLELYFEPYEGPFNTLDNTRLADVPMGEFWTHSRGEINCKVVASARAEGKKIVAAEAFTSRPERSGWTEDPAFLKKSADGAFASGVNRLILHHWVHQPFDERYKPGLGMGWWGTHFGRYQTWYEPGKAFFKYISRIQYMLQQGEEVVEYLCLDEVAGNGDAISSSYLLTERIRVKDRRIVLPSGRSYAFLVCPALDEVDPKVLKKLKHLADRGVVLVGRPPQKARGLVGYPQADEWVQQTGRAIDWASSIEEARSRLSITPLWGHAADDKKVACLLRKTEQGYILFAANRTGSLQNDSLSIAAGAATVELWDPETGAVSAPVAVDTDGSRLHVAFTLLPYQSLFVVIGGEKSLPDTTAVCGASMPLSLVPGREAVSLSPESPWTVDFFPAVDTPFSCRFDRLIDFSRHTDKRIAYFSGRAVYRTSFYCPDTLRHDDNVWLDLGELNDIAEVKVNGDSLGVWWYPPYRKSIRAAVRPGRNDLEIVVTNNWANRLIGDERFPADFEWGSDRGRLGRAIKSYPDWFLSDTPRPSKRKTFVVWSYYNRDSKLKPAGLAGPVHIIIGR